MASVDKHKETDPLALSKRDRRVGLAGVASAREALDRAKRQAPMVYRDLVKPEDANR